MRLAALHRHQDLTKPHSARERRQPWRSTQPRAGGELRSAKKLLCREALLAFKLQFDELKPCARGATHQQPLLIGPNLTRFRKLHARGISDGHAMHDQLLPVEHRERTWPWLKTTPAISKLLRRMRRKVHSPIFAIEQRGKCRLCLILHFRLNRAVIQTQQGLDNERRSTLAQRDVASIDPAD